MSSCGVDGAGMAQNVGVGISEKVSIIRKHLVRTVEYWKGCCIKFVELGGGG